MGTLGLLGSDDLLACFIAGNAFTWDGWYHVETKNVAGVMQTIDMLLNLSMFMYIGFIMVCKITQNKYYSYVFTSCLFFSLHFLIY